VQEEVATIAIGAKLFLSAPHISKLLPIEKDGVLL